MSIAQQKTVAILGGGISGLTAAYYIRKKYGDLVKPIIIERTRRLGGWIKSIRKEDNVFETGPRTIRPAGLVGLNTLDLIEDIGLDKKVLYVPPDHPATINRFIYTKGALVRIPTDLRMVFRTTPPLERPLYRAVLRDIFKRRVRDDDDSLYDFAQRRFGNDIAEYLTDPMIRGICAGDSKDISVKFLLRQFYYYEQKYGSVLLGAIINKIFNRPTQAELLTRIPGYKSIGKSTLAETSGEERWAMWTLEGGLESLVKELESKLRNEMDTTIILDSTVKTIKFRESRDVPSDKIEISCIKEDDEKQPEIHSCDYVISTIPAWRFSKIIRKSKPSHPSLWQLLNLISATDVIVTNVLYKNSLDILKEEAFGFLVPSNEVQNTPSIQGLLGVVFDTCTIAQGNDTLLTIMSQPIKVIVESTDQEAEVRKFVRQYLKTTLNIDKEPDDYQVSIQADCIPQYSVGHYEKVDGIRMFINAAKVPVLVCGASYDGVSVNDCIFSARKAVEELPFHNLLKL